MCIHIYIYIYTYIHTYIHICIYGERERKRQAVFNGSCFVRGMEGACADYRQCSLEAQEYPDVLVDGITRLAPAKAAQEGLHWAAGVAAAEASTSVKICC